MRYLILGALLGLLLLYPSLLAVVASVAAWTLGKPLLVGLAVGLVVRPHLVRGKRWAP